MAAPKKELSVSPLAPKTYPQMPKIDGVAIKVVKAGIRYTTRTDLMLMTFDQGTAVAGVFTNSVMPSAAVDWCRKALKNERVRGLVVNSGNSNAFTGKAGAETVKTIGHHFADILGCDKHDIFQSSTGIIGELMRPDKILPHCTKDDDGSYTGTWEDAAKAIMTTDTFPKMATRTAEIDGVTVTLNGICKGSGMIAPNMGTMLAYIATDANIKSSALQGMIEKMVDKTFNSISVDSDISTSDTFLLFATGKAKHDLVKKPSDKRLADFKEKLFSMLHEMALMIVKDGEGATHMMTVTVEGAKNDESAYVIGKAIIDSPLVKTAVAAGDPNWGRIVGAVGKSGQWADRDKLSLWIGDHPIAVNGTLIENYDEKIIADYMQNLEIAIRVNVAIGKGKATVYGCDLTEGYIRINADYRNRT